jgi:hypothetical protein
MLTKRKEMERKKKRQADEDGTKDLSDRETDLTEPHKRESSGDTFVNGSL